MLKSKSLQKGFTIVELLIVIVVIGILAALVLNTFSGVQKRARDTQRQTDTNALFTQLEAYYNEKGGYPTLAQWNSIASATTLFKGVSEDALVAPNPATPTTFAWRATATTNTADDYDDYGYVVNAGCVTADKCTSFTLWYTKEDSGPTAVSKKSLNQ